MSEFQGRETQLNGPPEFLECDAQDHLGNTVPVGLSVIEIKSTDQKRYLGVIRDLSANKIREHRLASTETKLLAMYASSLAACMRFNLDTMKLCEFNEATEKMLDGTTEQIMGLHPADFSPEFQSDGRPSAIAAKEEIETTTKNGTNHFFWTHKRLTGEEFPCEINTCVREYDGKQFFVASIRDMTEQMRSERKMQSINEELQQKTIEANVALQNAEKASAAKSNFMANMSHELRTPLNAILGFSETMSLGIFGSLSPAYKGYAQDIHSSASHLMGMIGDLLDLSRIEAGKVELFEEDVSLCEAVNEAIQIVSSGQSKDKADFIPLKAAADFNILADPRIFRQILINVIGNAAKFSAPGQVISVDCALIDDALHLTILDQGIGIEPEELDRLFDPYARSRSATSHKRTGTGLGLPISRSLIEVHGGTLWLSSEAGVGTKATIVVPAERVKEWDSERALKIGAT